MSWGVSDRVNLAAKYGSYGISNFEGAEKKIGGFIFIYT